MAQTAIVPERVRLERSRARTEVLAKGCRATSVCVWGTRAFKTSTLAYGPVTTTVSVKECCGGVGSRARAVN